MPRADGAQRRAFFAPRSRTVREPETGAASESTRRSATRGGNAAKSWIIMVALARLLARQAVSLIDGDDVPIALHRGRPPLPPGLSDKSPREDVRVLVVNWGSSASPSHARKAATSTAEGSTCRPFPQAL
eukprot:3198032-Alexandrium_andersonii.AAC.2